MKNYSIQKLLAYLGAILMIGGLVLLIFSNLFWIMTGIGIVLLIVILIKYPHLHWHL